MKRLVLIMILLGCAAVQAQQHNRDLKYMKKRAQRLMEEMNLGFAIVHLERSIEIHPQDGELRMLMGECLFELDRYAEAAESFATGVKHQADLLARVPHYPLALVRVGRLDEAMKLYEEMSAIGTPEAIEHGEYGKGLVCIHKGSPKKALEHLKRALHYDPDSQKINFRIGYVLRQTGALKEAKAHFESVVSRDALHEPALHNLAMTCHQLKLREEARAWKKQHARARLTLVQIGNLKRAIAANPQDRKSLAALADIWYTHRLWGRAYGPYRALTVAYPTNPEPRFRMAHCLFQKGGIDIGLKFLVARELKADLLWGCFHLTDLDGR